MEDQPAADGDRRALRSLPAPAGPDPLAVEVDYNLVGKVLIYVSTAFWMWSAGEYFRVFLNSLGKRPAVT